MRVAKVSCEIIGNACFLPYYFIKMGSGFMSVRRGFRINITGGYEKFKELYKKVERKDYLKHLDELAQKGVEALREATPVDSGKTAESWSYEIFDNEYGLTIVFLNSNVIKGWANVAILLQTGHGTRNGGYVAGRDYINPAIQPIFDEIAEKIWQEVTS